MRRTWVAALVAAATGVLIALPATAGAQVQTPALPSFPVIHYHGVIALNKVSNTTTTPTFQARWTWTQHGTSGICSESGKLSRDDGASWVDADLSLGQTSYTFTAQVGGFYRIEVTEGDCSSPPIVKPYDDYTIWSMGQEGVATYSHSWVTGHCTCWSGGTVKYSTVSGSTATFTFIGRSVQLVSDVGPTRGTASVSIDGKSYAGINTYSPTKRSLRIVFRTAGLKDTVEHTIVITTQNGRTDIDAFLYGW